MDDDPYADEDAKRRRRLYEQYARDVAKTRTVTEIVGKGTDEEHEETFALCEFRGSPEELADVPKVFFPQDPIAVLRTIFFPCGLDYRVAFGSRRPTKPKKGATKPSAPAPHWLAHLTVEELLTDAEGKLSRILEYNADTETQYVTLNPVRIGKHWLQPGLPEGGTPRYWPATNETAAQVRAFFVDLDVGREGLPTDEVILGASIARARSGELPMPSLAARSGRGAYLIWLLHPETIVQSVGKDPVSTMWKEAEAEIVRRLGSFHSDDNAKRIVNWLKRPGTLDTKTHRTVQYYAFVEHLADVPVYVLREMHERFRAPYEAGSEWVRQIVRADGSVTYIPIKAPRQPSETATRKRKITPLTKARRPGWGTEPARKRIGELLQLNVHRGGVLEGEQRRTSFIRLLVNAACEVAAREMKPLPEVERYAWALARAENEKFRPPFAPEELRAVVDPTIAARAKAFGRGASDGDEKAFLVKGEVASRKLQITPQEATALGLIALAPASVKRQRKDAEKRKRSEKERRVRLRDSMAAKGASVEAIMEATGYGRRAAFMALRAARRR